MRGEGARLSDDHTPTASIVAVPTFEDFFRSNYHGVVGLVAALCGRRAVAEELAQEAFVARLPAMGPDRGVRPTRRMGPSCGGEPRRVVGAADGRRGAGDDSRPALVAPRCGGACGGGRRVLACRSAAASTPGAVPRAAIPRGPFDRRGRDDPRDRRGDGACAPASRPSGPGAGPRCRRGGRGVKLDELGARAGANLRHEVDLVDAPDPAAVIRRWRRARARTAAVVVALAVAVAVGALIVANGSSDNRISTIRPIPAPIAHADAVPTFLWVDGADVAASNRVRRAAPGPPGPGGGVGCRPDVQPRWARGDRPPARPLRGPGLAPP